MSLLLATSILCSDRVLAHQGNMGTSIQKRAGEAVSVKYDQSDAEQGEAFVKYAKAGEKLIVKFFGKPFNHDLTLNLLSNRKSFDAALGEAWKMPKTERWMVGAADAMQGFFLSPACWKVEADEHDPSDTKGIEMIVAHELTHSYHGQNNVHSDFDGMDPMAWFVEGLATYVSGQEGTEFKGRAKLEASKPSFPTKFEDIWKGKSKYPLAGSLIRYVDAKYQRKNLIKLLAATSNDEAMKTLGTTESLLLADWKAWLINQKG